jgi:hypothetical protein
MSQNEEAQTELILSRGDWEGFLSSLEHLITLHQKTLQRLKDLRTRNVAIRTELRSALALPTLEIKPATDESIAETLLPVRICRYCSNEIATSSRFCDRCGRVNAILLCKCGSELAGSDKFCDRCGRHVIVT